MPKTKKEEYHVGYKVFFRGAVKVPGFGQHLRSAVSPNSCKCWHPDCPRPLTLGVGRGLCERTEDGGLWQSYDYGPGHFTAALQPEEAPLTVFEKKADALRFMKAWEQRSMCLELWQVSYVPGSAPELHEQATLPRGTMWARSIRPDELVITLRELCAKDKKNDEEPKSD